MSRRHLLGHLLGFPVYAEPTFLLLIALYFVLGGSGPGALVGSGVFVLAALLALVLHELGHAVTARRMGSTGIAIVLHGAGGLTYYTPLQRPRRALAVTAAGPAVGLLFGGLLYGLRQVLGPLPVPLLDLLLQDSIFINLSWSLFNLLPMMPLDGGHLLQDLLLLLGLARQRAVELALAVSFVVAVVAGVLALVQGWYFVALVCLFSGQLSWTQMGGAGPLRRFVRNLRG